MGRAYDMNASVSISSYSKRMQSKMVSSDYDEAANKVLAALGALRGDERTFQPMYIGEDQKQLELPDGDRRKHMVPKVVLQDIRDVIMRVSPKLYCVNRPESANPIVKRKQVHVPHHKTSSNGFRGFPDHTHPKTVGARFHVNTNILANSLDFLNERETVNIESPSTCYSCGITFSSIRHCKYHQSVCAAALPFDSSRHSSIQDEGVWLCPWCPVVCSQLVFLNQHKPFCREKGKCTVGNNSSSQRNTIKRRNTIPQVDLNQLCARLRPFERKKSGNKFCEKLDLNSKTNEKQYPVIVLV